MIARSSLPKVQARRGSSKRWAKAWILEKNACWRASLAEAQQEARNSPGRSLGTSSQALAVIMTNVVLPQRRITRDGCSPPSPLCVPLLSPTRSSSHRQKCGVRWFPVAACCAACERSSRRLSSDAERPSGEGRAGVVGRRDGDISSDGGDDSAVSPKAQPPGPWCQMIGHWRLRETEIPGLH